MYSEKLERLVDKGMAKIYPSLLEMLENEKRFIKSDDMKYYPKTAPDGKKLIECTIGTNTYSLEAFHEEEERPFYRLMERKNAYKRNQIEQGRNFENVYNCLEKLIEIGENPNNVKRFGELEKLVNEGVSIKLPFLKLLKKVHEFEYDGKWEGDKPLLKYGITLLAFVRNKEVKYFLKAYGDKEENVLTYEVVTNERTEKGEGLYASKELDETYYHFEKLVTHALKEVAHS